MRDEGQERVRDRPSTGKSRSVGHPGGVGHRCYRFRTGARPMLKGSESALYSVRSGLIQYCSNAS